MGRPREHDEQTRQRLLDAAGRILALEGSPALSVRRVAAEVGTTTRAIYSLFGSKHGLVRALCYEGFSALDRRIAAVSESDDPAADVAAMLAAYRAAALARPDLYQVMFAVPVPFEPTRAEQAFSLRPLDRLRAAVTRGVDAGAFPRRDPNQLTMQIWALAHGLASLELRGAFRVGSSAEGCWREAVAALLGGYRQADGAAAGDEGVPAVSDELRTAIAGIDGVVESQSMFRNDLAYWVHGNEIVHFHDGGVIEIRLTREIIGRRRDQLNSDPRVERRAPSSDWVVASFQLPQDRDFVLELVEAAVDAHRAPYGVTPDPPPEGPGLERRRRFH